MDVKINTDNPEALTYTTEEIAYTILGGIRLEGFFSAMTPPRVIAV